jgi:hypothetical protein
MGAEQINHALAAHDQLRPMIESGNVKAFAYVSVTEDGSPGPQAFVPQGMTAELYLMLSLLLRRYMDEILALHRPKHGS